MANNANDYLKTRRGLKAMLLFCSSSAVDDAVKRISSFGLSMGHGPVTLESDPDVWDTMFDMYCMQRGITI